MKDLPRLVQRAPAFFYAAAVIYFVASVLLAHLQLGGLRGSDGAPDSLNRLMVLSIWLQAAVGSLYLVANGVIARILLAIWGQGRRESDQRGDE